MKERLQDLLLVGGIISIFVLSIYGLIALDRNERERAISRCGGENNIIERDTTTGETYYICKVQK